MKHTGMWCQDQDGPTQFRPGQDSTRAIFIQHIVQQPSFMTTQNSSFADLNISGAKLMPVMRPNGKPGLGS